MLYMSDFHSFTLQVALLPNIAANSLDPNPMETVFLEAKIRLKIYFIFQKWHNDNLKRPVTQFLETSQKEIRLGSNVLPVI